MIGRIYPQPVTRYWKCNDGTYTDVSDRRYACRRHGGIQSPEPVEVCSPDATAAAAGVYLVPLGEIYVNHDWFQNRKAAFSLRSVENIVQAAQTGAFRWASFDPITLWQSPDGKKYVLSGHSRTEAFTRCCNLGLKADGRDFCRIPAKIQTGISLEEAQKIAMESNTLSTRESDLERSAYYRKMLAQGTAPSEVIKSAGRMEGKEATKIIAFAYLNPSGKTWNALQALETADQTSRNNMQNIGRWIGNARRTIPALSDRHEDEIYDWLVTNKSYGTAKGQISSETDFGARLRTIIQKRTTFGVLEENLNIQNAVYQSPVELEYSAQISAAFQEVTDLDKKLKAKIRELTARGATEDQIRTITEGMEAALRRARIKYQTLVQKRSEVSEAARNELALFGIGQIVATQPPGVTLCRNSKYSTLATRPGVCSHNGGVVEKTMAKPGKKKVEVLPDVIPTPEITPAPAELPAPAPVMAPAEPESYWKIDENGKAELHFEYRAYKALEDKKEVKSYFLWSRPRTAWVSKGAWNNYSVQRIIEKLGLPLAGKDQRLTFEESVERSVENAERRAERRERQANRAEALAAQLMREREKYRGDISFWTQPNVNSTGGRAFTRQRERIINNYFKGISQIEAADRLRELAEDAAASAQKSEYKNPAYVMNRIKEAEKDFKTLFNWVPAYMEKAAKSEDEETMIKAEAYQDKMNQAAQKMAFFMQIWDDLTTAGKTYDKERLKGAVYVRRSKGWDWHKVYKLNPKTVSHTWFVGAWNSPYSEIVDAVYEGESFTVEPSHVKGSFKITKTPSLSGYSFYRKNQKTL